MGKPVLTDMVIPTPNSAAGRNVHPKGLVCGLQGQRVQGNEQREETKRHPQLLAFHKSKERYQPVSQPHAQASETAQWVKALATKPKDP